MLNNYAITKIIEYYISGIIYIKKKYYDSYNFVL